MAFAIEKEERFAAYNAQMCLRHARQVRKEIHDKFVSPSYPRSFRYFRKQSSLHVPYHSLTRHH